ncbi:hypothetical protein J5N97_020782 [Dioscorea zingiberensis]|uniref:Uncharacterized protein n=1 Tax=Dioscorea zingiberensis TaxID=325984 RepID=A0A9D5CGH2_9LILI|nr:hypothetical protein J5N97_020782 [Dioscorea zingiberensis]
MRTISSPSSVFKEEGFRSYDIQLTVLCPPPPILRFRHAARSPLLFQRNFDVSFPFSLSSCNVGDKNCRRIGKTLMKMSGRNPILIGVGAVEAALDFARAIEQQSTSVVPAELRGVKLVKIKDWDAREVEKMGRGMRVKNLIFQFVLSFQMEKYYSDVKGAPFCSSNGSVLM